MKSKKGTQKKIQKKIRNAERAQKLYFLIPWLTALSMVWGSVVLTCLPTVFIENNHYKWYTVLVTIVLFLPLAVLTIVQAHYDRALKEDDVLVLNTNVSTLYRELINSFNNIVNKKVNRLSRSIALEASVARADPVEQVSDIFNEMRRCLSFLLSNKSNRIEPDDIYINLLYCINGSTVWEQIEKNQEGLSYEGLMKEQSFFRFLLNNKPNYVFYNSKQEVLEQQHYIQDSRDSIDDNNKLKGSIVGYKFDAVKTDGNQVQVLLFISTFTKRFVEEKKEGEDISIKCERVKQNIKNNIIDQFVPRMKIELCNDYIEKIMQERIGF